MGVMSRMPPSRVFISVLMVCDCWKRDEVGSDLTKVLTREVLNAPSDVFLWMVSCMMLSPSSVFADCFTRPVCAVCSPKRFLVSTSVSATGRLTLRVTGVLRGLTCRIRARRVFKASHPVLSVVLFARVYSD